MSADDRPAAGIRSRRQCTGRESPGPRVRCTRIDPGRPAMLRNVDQKKQKNGVNCRMSFCVSVRWLNAREKCVFVYFSNDVGCLIYWLNRCVTLVWGQYYLFAKSGD